MLSIPRWMRFHDPDSLENRSETLVRTLVDGVEKTIARYHRAEVRGAEHVPGGPALYVGNHNSFAYTPDTYLFCAEVFRRHGMAAVPYGLAHEWIMSLPFINQSLAPMGAVRASHENGQRLLQAGKKVLVYPGGDLDAMRPFRRRHEIVFEGRTGFVRLALEAGVPIIPVVSAGAHSTIVILDDMRGVAQRLGLVDAWRIKAFPITLSFPWGLTLGPPPPFVPFPSRILVELLPPVHFDRSGPEAAADEGYVDGCARRVQRQMQQALDRLAEERRRLRHDDLRALVGWLRGGADESFEHGDASGRATSQSETEPSRARAPRPRSSSSEGFESPLPVAAAATSPAASSAARPSSPPP